MNALTEMKIVVDDWRSSVSLRCVRVSTVKMPMCTCGEQQITRLHTHECGGTEELPLFSSEDRHSRRFTAADMAASCTSLHRSRPPKFHTIASA